MIDAIQLLARRSIKPWVIERSSERPGATGHVLSLGRFVPVSPASGALEVAPASCACDAEACRSATELGS